MENGEQFEFDAAEDLLLNVRAIASSCFSSSRYPKNGRVLECLEFELL